MQCYLLQVNATEANTEGQVHEYLSNFPYIALCLKL